MQYETERDKPGQAVAPVGRAGEEMADRVGAVRLWERAAGDHRLPGAVPADGRGAVRRLHPGGDRGLRRVRDGGHRGADGAAGGLRGAVPQGGLRRPVPGAVHGHGASGEGAPGRSRTRAEHGSGQDRAQRGH